MKRILDRIFPPPAEPRRRIEPTGLPPARDLSAEVLDHALSIQPRPARAGDSCIKQDAPLASLRGMDGVGLNPGIMGFFAGQALPMSYHQCALLGTHWLIDKALRMPADDAVRQGWTVSVDEEKIRRIDKRMRIGQELSNFIAGGRQFGIRFALFLVKSDNPRYYEYPFNPDGVAAGSYQGVSQIDPYWCEPVLTNMDLTDPTRKHFYEPEWWIVGGRRIHRSHFVIYRNGEVPDYLKPMFRYGGVSVTQRIVERVYNAERTANEAPELAMTKRTSVFKTDLAEVALGDGRVEANLDHMARFRNNYGIKLADKEDSYEQHDTSLADFDSVVMGQYQLVAGAANVPATKLMGTTPKGFNATGEYEEAAYHEMLESLQTAHGDPFLDRHYLLLQRSMGLAEPIEHTWLPLDTPTAKEYADTELVKAQRDVALQASGAIDAEDIRARLAKERDGDYFGLEPAVPDDLLTDESAAGNTGAS